LKEISQVWTPKFLPSQLQLLSTGSQMSFNPPNLSATENLT
jgi:hypothetical protein